MEQPPPRARFAVLAWLVVVCASGLLEQRCGHTRYDYRASRRAGCTVLKAAASVSDRPCYQPPSGCVDAETLMTFSPRALSDMAGNGGPLLTWLPVLMAYREQLPVITATILARTVIWYLTVIGTTRHLHLLTGGWDPSGHAVVYGAQLVPLWELLELGHAAGGALGAGRTLLLCWLLVWAGVLCYLSVMTAAAFHTLSETAVAVAMVLGLAAWLRAPSDAPGVGVQARHVACAAVAWVVPTAASWLPALGASGEATAGEASGPPQAVLVGMLLYDMAVWACFAALLSRDERNEMMVGVWRVFSG